jgi:asparagine synthase (glutamine-hydrolysing)
MSACLRDLRYDELCRPELRRAEAHPGRSNILDRATALDFTNYLPGDVLTKVDRASMLCSLEIRAPLLDRHIIEFGFGRLSPEQRATERARKVLLRELASRQLPTDFDVSRKQGFSVPLEYWFNEAWAPVLDSWTDHESLLVSKGTISRLRKRMASWTTAQDLYSVGVLLGWEKKQRITDVTD